MVFVVFFEVMCFCVECWKMGFYCIVEVFNVLIGFGYFDWMMCIGGVGLFFELIGVFEEDIECICLFYFDFIGCF